MIIKGIVTNIINSNEARIVIPSSENKVSYTLEVSRQVGVLEVGNTVLAAFYTKTDGVIIAILR